MIRKNPRRFLTYMSALSILAVLTCAASCSYRSDTFHEFTDIPARGWDKRNIQKFYPYVDSAGIACDIDVELNYDNRYGYRNLYLFITVEDADKTVVTRDTLNCMLADEFGKWLGSGWGSSFQQSFPYKRGIVLGKQGAYSVSVSQGMRKDIIEGIERVGLRISPSAPDSGD